MIKKLYTALYADDCLYFFYEDSGDNGDCCNKMSILGVNVNNTNLDNNFDEDDPDTLFLLDFWLGIVNLKNVEHLKKRQGKN